MSELEQQQPDYIMKSAKQIFWRDARCRIMALRLPLGASKSTAHPVRPTAPSPLTGNKSATTDAFGGVIKGERQGFYRLTGRRAS